VTAEGAAPELDDDSSSQDFPNSCVRFQ